jgi:hypothetical protein
VANSPLFTGTPKIQFNATNTLVANTAVDGTGTLTTFYTAGGLGGYLSKIQIRSRGTNVATVLRVFCNGGLFAEVGVPLTTASQVAQLLPFDIPVREPLPANAVMSYTIGTAVAAGFTVMGIGGDY